MEIGEVLTRQRRERDLGLAVHDAEDAPAADSASAARRDAFRRLVDLHLDRYYRLAAVILGDAVVAQDAVHDAFVQAWRKWDSLREPARFEAWFGRIVVNTCRNLQQRERRRVARDISECTGLRAPDSLSTVPDQLVIREAFRRLKPEDRTILALRYYLDLKVDDIAVVMGLRSRAAASRLHRALERLRLVLEEDATKDAVA
jgi:RNA polymerase sigma-70 factor (ECF subfamily)